MTKRRMPLLFLTGFFLLSAVSVSAQTTGSIRGRTVDADGQQLPGVTIVVSGDSLGSAQRTSVTSASGGFQIAALPIGSSYRTA